MSVIPMRIQLDRDETGEVRVFCTMCVRLVGQPLGVVSGGVITTSTPFNVLMEHLDNGHDGILEEG